MKMNKTSIILKKAPFPAIMTIISFMAFVSIYYLLITTSVEPNYLVGLIFLVPFVCFGITTFIAAKERYRIAVSSLITCVLVIVLSFLMLYALAFISFESATKVTTDIGKYQRVLKLSDYPNNRLINCFPSEIPTNAKNIAFHYNPAFLQGGETFALKFETNSETIKNYGEKFLQRAKWVGKSSDSEAENNGAFICSLEDFGYVELPEDFTIYLIDSKSYQPNNWNHGYVTLVAISKQRNEIIFYAESW